MLIAFATSAKAYNFPQCDDGQVEARIFRTFSWAERSTWQRGIDLISLSRVHEHRTTQFEGSIVTRRYCMAHGAFFRWQAALDVFHDQQPGRFRRPVLECHPMRDRT